MKKVINYTIAISLFVALIVYVILVRDANFTLEPLYEDYWRLLFQGFLNTLYVSFIALLGSLILGFIMYLMSISKSLFFRAFVDVFTEIIYGTPLLVMIVLMAFLIGPAFGNFNRPFLGITGLILYISPYMKNVFQSSFSSIPK
jgi:polar amino acid transport system permease protein